MKSLRRSNIFDVILTVANALHLQCNFSISAYLRAWQKQPWVRVHPPLQPFLQNEAKDQENKASLQISSFAASGLANAVMRESAPSTPAIPRNDTEREDLSDQGDQPPLPPTPSLNSKPNPKACSRIDSAITSNRTTKKRKPRSNIRFQWLRESRPFKSANLYDAVQAEVEVQEGEEPMEYRRLWVQ
ncbi:uncharacterized protein MYCFIDRAFT_198537 [Pseudocercospora fijiensis CIRAD86]|uniref:Uncharacterized protein n=1 Tax=Pseudocercospora fijiensis (strain CIRAD86) TaxID=383855 RepID=M3A6N8_PSEFD|nr:uncharacterized protein MYCFIDRAFT_198537 [Pseudocercospora fijiensis CIRAD86]EME80261.1 hypothetical protein MYCFIDRAFT_198537 [Pseudocercospora fijiensis CIRAD86]